VGVPVYNAVKTIGRTLDSLINQDYDNLEIIVSDNCSDDGTYELCQEYAREDDRIVVSRNNENIGAGDNFLLVCRKSSGKYFFWAAGDDRYQPEFVGALVQDLENRPDAVVSLPQVTLEKSTGIPDCVVDFDGDKDPYTMPERELVRNLISFQTDMKYLRYNMFIHGLWRHERIKDLHLWYSFTRNMERPLLANMAMKYKFSYVANNLMTKRIHERSFKSRNPDDPISTAKRRTGLWGRYFFIFSLMFKDPLIRSSKQYAILASLIFEMLLKVSVHRLRFRAGSIRRFGRAS
jgi:glycosyltransferase involved in cell wall biosynthesis